MKNPDYMRDNSQKLRKSMTPEELHLWLDFLKDLPHNVRRQKVIDEYILDFYIPKLRIAIEIDGKQHGKEENRIADVERDSFLASMNIKVLRYRNSDINQNFNSVCKDILKEIERRKMKL